MAVTGRLPPPIGRLQVPPLAPDVEVPDALRVHLEQIVDAFNRGQDGIAQTLNPIRLNPLFAAASYRLIEVSATTLGNPATFALQYRTAGTTSWTTIVSFTSAGVPTMATTLTGYLKGTAGVVSAQTVPIPIADGGTGSTTQNFVDLTTAQASIAGNKGFTGTGTTIAQPTWTAITYAGTWGDFGGGYGAVQFMKDSLGFACMRGLAKGNGALNNTVITTLPAGVRPLNAASVFLPCDAGGGYGRLNITTAGVITNDVGNGTLALSFDGVRFDTRA